MPRFQSPIVGAKYNPGAIELLNILEDNATLELVREHLNPYDRNAVAVYSGPHHLGFITRAVAAKVAPIMDEKMLVRLKGRYDKTNQPFVSFELEVVEG